MAVTYGFYNSINHDRKYDAVQVGQVFDGIIHDGVYETYKKALLVKASSVANQVIIQPGRAWFNHTWTYNDADLPFTMPAPEALLERIDAVVLDINGENSVRVNSFKYVKGTPAASPSRPALTNSGKHHQYPLAYIHRYGNQNTIRADDITNMVGTSACPFVLGVIEFLTVDELLAQWTAQFNTYIVTKQNQWNTFQTYMEQKIAQFEEATETAFTNWMNAQKSEFTLWRGTQQNDFTTWRNNQQTAFTNWMTGEQNVFDTWFDHIKNQLDGDVATRLQEQIDAISYMYVIGNKLYLPNTGASISGTKLILTNHN